MGMRRFGLGAVCIVALGSAALAARPVHEFVGPEGNAFMRVPAVTRQAVRPTQEVNITLSAGDDRDPCWSADGTLIAFASNRAGDYNIYLCRTDGSNPDTGVPNTPKLVSGLPGDERYPAWSPGGTELAYVRSGAIYIRNLRNGIESLVNDTVGQPTGLVFSFDGTRLAFSSSIGTDITPQIYWLNIDPNNPHLERVTDSTSQNIAPAWFPQSAQIAWASNRDGDFDVFAVNVPGVNAGPVPENTWTKLVGGAGDQIDPAWVSRGGIVNNPLYNQAFHLIYADNADTGQTFEVKLADSDGTPTGDIVFSDSAAVAPTDQFEPFANPVQNSASNLCCFSGNQVGNFEIYTTQIFAGADVRIEAPIFDIGSGVQEAWALIRLAERPAYQRSRVITGGTGGDDGVINGATNKIYMGNINHEFDQMIINATTYAALDPTALSITPNALLNMVRNNAVRLRDDGTNGDQLGGDGIWSATWRTPAQAQDFYVDIIPIDNRNNFPVDTNLSFNSRPGGGGNDVIGYDHVTGFTTRQLDLTRKILFVSDYACGQKFQVADFAGADQTTLNRFWPAALPVEHWYFATDDNNDPGTPGQMPGMAQFFDFNTTPVLNVISAQPTYRAWGYVGNPSPQPPDFTGDPATSERFGGPPPTSLYGGLRQADLLAVWRILCRGPVDAPTLNAYTPLPLPPPPGSPIPAQDADRMILWISPYTGDLFVQAGTLLDADVQSALTNFVAAGGRLFMTGQDVAWALTKNGTQGNSFLTQTLHATFLSDAPPDVANQTVQSAVQRHTFVAGQGITGIEQQVFQTAENPLVFDMYPDYYRWIEDNASYDPPGEGGHYLRINQGGGNTGWAGDGCPNGWFIDDIAPASSGIATLNYTSGGTTGMVRFLDGQTGGRVIYCAFPFEGWRNEYTYVPGYYPNVNYVICGEDRQEVFTNVSDYLRTGALLGKVVGPDGSTPAGGITVIARLGFQPTGTIMATTTSLNDGTYLLRGLSTANYSVYVVSNEFTADHRPYQIVEGGMTNQDADLTIRLLRFETGTIFGTVTQTGGNTVAGATVTATLQTTGNNPFTASLKTDNNGQYSLDVPGGTYTVTAQAPGFGAASSTNVVVVAGDFVQVNLVLQPAPGKITGTVKGNNQPIGGASIAVIQNAITVASTTTNGAGAYEISLAAGTYDLTVTAAGFQQATKTGVDVLSDQTTSGVDFALTSVPPGSLTGLITLSGSSEPIGGVTVNVTSGGVILQSTTSSPTATVSGTSRYNYRFDNLPAGVYDIQIVARGFTATTKAGIQVTSGQTTAGVDFQLQPLHTFIAGLSMTCTPFDYVAVAPDIQTLVDADNNRATPLKLATWDTLSQTYIYYPNRPADTFRLGVGYFMKLAKNVALTTEGVRAPEVGTGQRIQLLTGWDLVGHPYEFPVDMFACQVIFQGTTFSMQDAIARGLVGGALYTLNFNQYQQVFRFDPYTAFWVRSFQNVLLQIPPTPLRSVSSPAAGRAVPTPGSWSASLVARTRSGLQATATIGTAPDAADVYDAHDRAEPPRPPAVGFLTMTFPHADWGRYAGSYRSDVRGQARTQSWTLEVNVDRPGEDIELAWPDLNKRVPAGVRVVLHDLSTGIRRSLRQTGGYQFRQAEAGTRTFTLQVDNAEPGLAVAQMQYEPGRGAGGALTYVLSAPAAVDVVVRGASGRVVRQLLRAVSQEGGTQVVRWDGRDDNGRPVPNGTYTIEVVGRNELGEQVRAQRVVTQRR
ncbi:MAG: carboxypeptidase regulatory-like domain-containing protein [Armatimonadetes bacterium]|nr:carboxypeptidase regulatory-like domain-containing protein [Armatimonadota bacterium]